MPKAKKADADTVFMTRMIPDTQQMDSQKVKVRSVELEANGIDQ